MYISSDNAYWKHSSGLEIITVCTMPSEVECLILFNYLKIIQTNSKRYYLNYDNIVRHVITGYYFYVLSRKNNILDFVNGNFKVYLIFHFQFILFENTQIQQFDKSVIITVKFRKSYCSSKYPSFSMSISQCLLPLLDSLLYGLHDITVFTSMLFRLCPFLGLYVTNVVAVYFHQVKVMKTWYILCKWLNHAT